jgi:hypothetical protein
MAAARSTGRAHQSNRDLAADLHDLLGRQVEIIRHVGGITLHDGEHRLARQKFGATGVTVARVSSARAPAGRDCGGAEMTHIGVERFGTSDAEKDAAQARGTGVRSSACSGVPARRP